MSDINVLNNCPICGGTSSKILPYVNLAYSKALELNGLQINVCGKCGLGSTFPERSWKDMQSFYERSYRASDSVHRNVARPLVSKYSISPRALSQWMLLRIFRSFSSSDSFCDIGPGGGTTFQTALFLGMNLKKYAYEPDESNIANLSELGVEVYPKSFNPETELSSARFSAIILSHVLEHFSVSDSIGVLKKIQKMLRADGVLLCEVPNVDMAKGGEVRKDDSPHLTFWTVAALQKAVTAAGMRVLFMSTVGPRNGNRFHEPQISVGGKISWFIRKALLHPRCPGFMADVALLIRNYFNHGTVYKTLAAPDFEYGEGRECIRIVCAI